ncbi:hypothetical protein ACIBQ5_21210 [Streptomyces massasporeus]|uniref:hypothetical protein n=1 Tax=Streptomyces massasporeus TaxID=67324 RepID=UPI003789F21C
MARSDPDVPDRTVGRAVPPERPPSESADSALTSGLFQTAAPFVVGPAVAFEEPRDPSLPDEEGQDPSPPDEKPRDPSPPDEEPRDPSPPDEEPRDPSPPDEEGQDPSPPDEKPRDPSPPDEEGQDPPPSDPVSSPLVAMLTVGRPDPSLRISQPHMALPAVPAADPDPLRAALDAVYAAVVTYGEDHPALLAEVRSFCEERPAPPVPRFTP